MGAFDLIENMGASSANECYEHERSRMVNSVEAKWRDDLTVKVNLLLKVIREKLLGIQTREITAYSRNCKRCGLG